MSLAGSSLLFGTPCRPSHDGIRRMGRNKCQALSGSSADLAVMSLAGSSLLFGIGTQALP
jgi:hypothetical protein